MGPSSESSVLTRPDGGWLAYEVRGAGPPVVLVQGVGTPGAAWRPQADALAGRFRCLTFDHRGVGGSGPPSPVTVGQMAADVAALMDARGWASAHVVGHSLGGAVALQLALSARPRVRSLGLLCTFARGRDAAPITRRMVWAGLRVRFGPRAVRRRAFLELVLPPAALWGADRDAVAAGLAPLFGRDLGDLPPAGRYQLPAMRAFDATPRLGELAGLPTLVVSAASDPIAPPRLGRDLAAGIPGARYIELADASHGVPIHSPDRINAVLADHLAAAEAGYTGVG